MTRYYSSQLSKELGSTILDVVAIAKIQLFEKSRILLNLRNLMIIFILDINGLEKEFDGFHFDSFTIEFEGFLLSREHTKEEKENLFKVFQY